MKFCRKEKKPYPPLLALIANEGLDELLLGFLFPSSLFQLALTSQGAAACVREYFKIYRVTAHDYLAMQRQIRARLPEHFDCLWFEYQELLQPLTARAALRQLAEAVRLPSQGIYSYHAQDAVAPRHQYNNEIHAGFVRGDEKETLPIRAGRYECNYFLLLLAAALFSFAMTLEGAFTKNNFVFVAGAALFAGCVFLGINVSCHAFSYRRALATGNNLSPPANYHKVLAFLARAQDQLELDALQRTFRK